MDYDKDESIQTETDSPNTIETGKNEQHPFDRLMFGSSRNKHHVEDEKRATETPAEDNLLNQVNLEEILMHIDSLVGTAKQLKPMFSKIKPLFDQFLKK
ncbi:hypothetical protein [Mesobacillus maritimus]|uniref:Spore coat protein n=1 Tax=Mesobacillus maritimus TaxID=1643336 RepID=A0ABS7JZB3_9BACI|nr:hypothetical protein [Mesobacillus maritimus]MBY0095335.1 hypothetical protein [Mesobacillus maritimus]